MASRLPVRRVWTHRGAMYVLAVPIALMVVGLGSPIPAEAPLSTTGWPWPVRGPVIRGFDIVDGRITERTVYVDGEEAPAGLR